MPQTNLRASATAMPDATRLRARLAAAAERIIAALDALDAPDADLEHDDAELGIADDDGRIEQLVGEPDLGATHDTDQRTAWGPDRLCGVCEGEEDTAAPLDLQWPADRKAMLDARAQGLALLRALRRQRGEA
jgi:hypothetical protein